MKQTIKNTILTLGSPLTYASSAWLKLVKNAGPGKINNKIFMKLGVLPIMDHYYQPLINPNKYLGKSLRDDRELKGINFNVDEQLNLLSKFDYNEELLNIRMDYQSDTEYHYENSRYSSGDSEYLYNMIRHYKPKKLIEVGSGYSTLMARNAIAANIAEDSTYTCEHVCVEPYEQPWLEQINIKVIREKVEDLDKSLFEELEANDILFIDSSHVIRPQGDVLFEYLEVLPILNTGVLIHVHDIFTPKDYLDEWIYDDHLLWNEQYLLEAFLTFNSEYRIIGALNFLKHNHWDELSATCPIIAQQPDREPGAFWMVKN